MLTYRLITPGGRLAFQVARLADGTILDLELTCDGT